MGVLRKRRRLDSLLIKDVFFGTFGRLIFTNNKNSLVKLSFHLLFFLLALESFAQTKGEEKTMYPTQTLGIEYNIYLLGHPLVLHKGFTIAYTKKFLGKNRHQLSFAPRFGVLFIPEVENRFLFTVALQYKYNVSKRFETSIFMGINYILTRLAYDRYEYEGNAFVNKGRYLHQFAPSIGINIGYKVIQKPKFSIAPYVCIALVRFDKQNDRNFFKGYKPSISFGITIQK